MVHLPKLNCEEHFENLDMITTLLSKKPAKISKDNAAGKPLIEVEGLGGVCVCVFVVCVCVCVCVCVVCVCVDIYTAIAHDCYYYYYHYIVHVCMCVDMEGNASESEDDFDWQMEQQLPEDEGMNTPVSLTLPSCAYGFATQYQGVFAKLQVKDVIFLLLYD